MSRRIVILSGAPGTGKSTIAPALAVELGLPLFAKDTIKETLHDAMCEPGPVDRAWSKRLGAGAMELLWRLAADAPACLLEANFAPSISPRPRSMLSELAVDGSLIEVHCSCHREEAVRRYEARALTSARHPVHVEARYPDEWRELETVVGLGPVVEVDTTLPVDVRAIGEAVRSLWSTGKGIGARSLPSRPADADL
jgi:predicted kinase